MPGTADIEDGKVYGGLVWDYIVQDDNSANVYLFTIDKSGRYAIFSSKNSIHASSTSIVGLTQSDAIKTDADNVLRVEYKDGTISFFINGTKVHSMQYPYPKRV